jgi:hypothetical protein
VDGLGLVDDAGADRTGLDVEPVRSACERATLWNQSWRYDYEGVARPRLFTTPPALRSAPLG